MDTTLMLGSMLGNKLGASPTAGSRATAKVLRAQVEQSLEAGHRVILDFENFEATQSFVDELVGLVVLRHGPSVVPRLTFKRCSVGMKAIVRFVINDRVHQQKTLNGAFGPMRNSNEIAASAY